MLDAALTYGDGLDEVRWVLAALSLIASIGYLAIVHTPTSNLRTALKTISVAALAPLPLLNLGHEAAPVVALVCLAIALALGSAGDYFLALKDDPKNFQRGLIAFLIGHFFYLAVMMPHAGRPEGIQLAGVALLIAMSVGTFNWLSPKLGSHMLPVGIYMGVITLMALAALSIPAPLAGLGALLFVFSDAIIAIDKFRRPVPFRGPIIWVTYYAGQAFLAASLLAMLR
ncbi:MAG: lysoplasmalogenase [Parvibaculum sp.]|uniref:lysoplasmalogenase n=1 Tax=Parvibaculum sp. TaxID=2024848 RepID=UPI0025D3D303|nr:lysoplasmalogenase [Parvibaculum sp.]MCE9648528.1 lysoplasmalogenase [Parvibaculum sp.]